VTIMRVTEGLDSGPVALQEEVAITGEDDYESLSGRLATQAGEALVRALDLLERGELEFADQDEALATYAGKITPEERRLDPSRPAQLLELAVRALTPHIGAHLELDDGEWLGVREAHARPDGPPAGAIEADGEELLLGASDGALRLDIVQPPGGKPMSAADFLRGHSPPSRAL
jgi:methionyl-tRNA formyltransferase